MMKTIVTLGLILVISHAVDGQFNKKLRGQNSDSQYLLDKDGRRIRPPEFKGGYEAWIKYVNKKLRYPKDAKKKGIEGKVVVKFILDATGRVVPESVTVVESLSESCDIEAVRIVKGSPPWIPARIMDERMNIESEIKHPIMFRL